MKLLLLLSFFLIISCSSHKHKSINAKPANTYFLQGKIEGRDSGQVYLGSYDTTKQVPLIIFDSAKISGSYFHFHGLLPTPLICKLKITDLEYGWPYTHYFILDTGIINVKLFKDSMANSLITGSALNEQLLAFNKKLNELELTFEKWFPLNKQGIITDDSLEVLKKEFIRNKHDLILKQIHANPTGITSSFIAQNILTDIIDLPMLEEISDALRNADNYFVRYISSELAARKRSVIGMEAPSFEIVDDKNRTFTKDSFEGKFLLLDFWASWCLPCREESPSLIAAYNKYKDKGLEMISISIDQDKSEWQKAMKEDALGWIQACVGANSKIHKDFGIYFIPSNFLIDPQGKIIANNLTGADIEKTLGKYLKNN